MATQPSAPQPAAPSAGVPVARKSAVPKPVVVQAAAPKWDGSRVLFEVIDGGERVRCAISREALRQVTGRNYGKPAELLASFMQVRDRVETVALAKHRAQSSAAMGLLTVWSGDLDDHEDAEASRAEASRDAASVPSAE